MTLTDPPRLILFDLGGVIVDYRGADGLSRLIGRPAGPADLARWGARKSLHAFERGRIAPEEFARATIAEYGLEMDGAAFLAAYAAWVVEVFADVPAILRRLELDRPIACLSNINDVHWRRCVELGVDRLFATRLLSHEMGLRKPDREIYAASAAALGLRAGEILFLDDMEENVVAARAAGLRAMRVAHGQVGEALRDLASSGAISSDGY